MCFNVNCPATKVAGQENGFNTMLTEKSIFRTSEAAYAVDRNGQIVVWNQAAKKTFGYNKSEALGQHCWELLSGRDIFGNQSCCKGCPVRVAAFSNEPINRFQIDFKTATHERKRFTVSTLILFNGLGNEVFVHLCNPKSGVIKHSERHSAVSKLRSHQRTRPDTPDRQNRPDNPPKHY